MNDDEETYLLLLLSDSNLPTGSFVASSGLESYIKHGFSSSSEPTTLTFLRDSLASYARTTLAFVADSHRLVSGLVRSLVSMPNQEFQSGDVQSLLRKLIELDNLYEAMTLNHVARRASKAQGVALLTLYSKGFTTTPSLNAYTDSGKGDKERCILHLFDQFKLLVRREEVNGHLPICWGALTAALGLTQGECKAFRRVRWVDQGQNERNTFTSSYTRGVSYQQPSDSMNSAHTMHSRRCCTQSAH